MQCLSVGTAGGGKMCYQDRTDTGYEQETNEDYTHSHTRSYIMAEHGGGGAKYFQFNTEHSGDGVHSFPLTPFPPVTTLCPLLPNTIFVANF